MPQLSHCPGGAFSIITSTCTASCLSSSRPCSVSRFKVTENLLRISCRNCAPHSSPDSLSLNMYSLRPKGVSLRSGSPPGGSTWITSAPSSESCEEHQWPIIMLVVQSRTRTRESASGFSKLCSWRQIDSRKSGYSLAWSLRPAYTSSGFAVGTAGQGVTLASSDAMCGLLNAGGGQVLPRLLVPSVS